MNSFANSSSSSTGKRSQSATRRPPQPIPASEPADAAMTAAAPTPYNRDDEVLAQIPTFLVAGHETTSYVPSLPPFTLKLMR